VASERSNLLVGAGSLGSWSGGGWWNLAYQANVEDQPDGDALKTGRTSAAASIRARLGSSLDVGGGMRQEIIANPAVRRRRGDRNSACAG